MHLIPLDPTPSNRLSLRRIAESVQLIPREFLGSPQYECEALSSILGCAVMLKVEFLNPIRSFKGRGASLLVNSMIQEGKHERIVCASAGNWGQAVAYACRSAGLPVTIFASEGASVLKVTRMREFGATVIQVGQDFDSAKLFAKQWASERAAHFVEDGFDHEVSERHGSLAIELLASERSLDSIVVPLGNRALLTGVGRWIKAAAPGTRVIGVCAEGAIAMERSWRLGPTMETSEVDTIADGIAVRVPIPEAVSDMNGTVDDVLIVNDNHIRQAMRLVWRHAGLLTEPAGAAGIAALIAHKNVFAGQTVACILCGSNISPTQAESFGVFESGD